MLKKIVILLLIYSCSLINGQDYWQSLNGPNGGRIISLKYDGNSRVYVGTSLGGLYYSESHGETWNPILNDLLTNASISDILIGNDGVIFCIISNFRAGKNDFCRIVYSKDKGITWHKTADFTHSTPLLGAINSNGWLYIVPSGFDENTGLFRSTNFGATWEMHSSGLGGINSRRIQSIAIDNQNTILIGTADGLWKSIDGGVSWKRSDLGLPQGDITSIGISENKIFVGVRNKGLYSSSDSANSWQSCFEGENYTVNTITCLGNTIYIGTAGYGILYSTNYGLTWNQNIENLPESTYLSIAIDNKGYIFAGGYGLGVAVSSGHGLPWSHKSIGINATFVHELTISNNFLYAAVEGGIFKYNKEKLSWDRIDSDNSIEFSPWIRSIESDAFGNIYIGSAKTTSGKNGGIYKSTDMGFSWKYLGLESQTILEIFFNETTGTLFASAGIDGLFRSTDSGINWQNISINDYVGKIIRANEGILLAAGREGIYRSNDNGLNWKASVIWKNTTIGFNQTHSFAVNSKGDIFAATNLGIFKSIDNGVTWQRVKSPSCNSIIINSFDHIFIGYGYEGWVGGIYRSINNGIDWYPIETGLMCTFVSDLIVDSNGFIYAATNGGGVYKSIKSTNVLGLPLKPTLTLPIKDQVNLPNPVSVNWNKVKDAEKYFINLSNNPTFSDVIKSDSTTSDTSKAIIGLKEGQIYYWRVQAKNISGASPWSDVWSFKTMITAPTNLTIQRSALKELTLTWKDNSQSEDGYIIERKQSSQTTFTLLDTLKGSGNKCVDKTVQQGQTYTYRLKAYTKYAESNYSNEAMINVVGIEDEGIPTEYSLTQNYPNPFNPVTLFKFGVPEESNVTLSIYNILGQQVAELVNDFRAPGYYRVNWDASNYSSGVYIYRIEARPTNGDKSFMQMKKMIYMK